VWRRPGQRRERIWGVWGEHRPGTANVDIELGSHARAGWIDGAGYRAIGQGRELGDDFERSVELDR